MTLDAAILHAREVAERNRKQYKNSPSDRTDIRYQTCEECAEEHEQLAEWLEELKSYRASVFSGYMTQKMLKEEYNKAIDDLIAECENAKFAESDEISLSDVHTGVNSGLSMAIHFAEQLKAGVENE